MVECMHRKTCQGLWGHASLPGLALLLHAPHLPFPGISTTFFHPPHPPTYQPHSLGVSMRDEVPALTHTPGRRQETSASQRSRGLVSKSPSVETCQIVMKAIGEE